MSPIRRAAIALVALSPCLLGTCSGAGSGWAPSVAEARKQGKAQNKPILIEFTSPYCGPCAKMEKEVFTQPAIKAHMDRFVKAKADVMEPDMKALLKQHGFKQLPSFLYLRPTGTVALKISQVPRLADEFLGDMKQVLKREQAIASAQRMLSVSPTSTSAMYRLGMAYVDADEAALARGQFEQVLAAGGTGKHVAGASFQMARAYAAQGQCGKAAALLDAVLKLDPKNKLKLADQVLLARGKIHMAKGEHGKAYRCFARVIKIYDYNKKTAAEAQKQLRLCQQRMGR